jgi:TetR/AcrR family transcriptional regulator, transcriptional repressor for nem operon
MPQRSVKEQLIEHAEDVFRRQGFSAASVQDLTVAAGVPKGSFYNHFTSKQDMAREILIRYVRATDTSMLADERLPARERLRQHFAEQIERTMRTGLEFGCLLGTLSAESAAAGQEVRAGADTGFAQWVGAVAHAIAAGQRSGEIRTGIEPGRLAGTLIDGFEGATLRAKATGQTGPVDDFMTITLDRLLS